MINRSTKFIAVIAISAVTLLVTAGPANAVVPPTVSWSAATIAPGESVILNTTGWYDAITPANSLRECWYVGDSLS
jgi:hypothetical protein